MGILANCEIRRSNYYKIQSFKVIEVIIKNKEGDTHSPCVIPK